MGKINKIRIGTRNSLLARSQTDLAIEYIKSFYSDIEFEIIYIITQGDIIQDKPLYNIGGKALFTKELEQALIQNKIDIAIHSAKDIEDKYRKDLLCFPCVLPEEDNRDIFIGKNYKYIKSSILNLPKNSVIGSSSVRRQSQIKKIRSDLKFELIRGNIDTRLKKLETENFDGIILAYSGVKRLKLLTENMQILDKNLILPAVSQGIIAIQTRKNDNNLNELLQNITHQETDIKFRVYRSFIEKVEGSCTTPLAANVEIINNEIRGYFLISSINGKFSYEIEINDEINQAENIGKKAGEEIKKYLNKI